MTELIRDLGEPAALAAQAAGIVDGVYITPDARGPMRSVERVRAEPGRGLEGDRYWSGVGTFSSTPGGSRHLTLIDGADLDLLEAEHGIRLEPGASRRNLVTRGIALLDLIGKPFWVGGVLCEGIRACPPCKHLESLTHPGVAKGLIGRGGLRAEILQSGVLGVGDTVRPAD